MCARTEVLIFLHDEVADRVWLAPNLGNVIHPERQETVLVPPVTAIPPPQEYFNFLSGYAHSSSPNYKQRNGHISQQGQ